LIEEEKIDAAWSLYKRGRHLLEILKIPEELQTLESAVALTLLMFP
jgi:hypothetical protein